MLIDFASSPTHGALGTVDSISPSVGRQPVRGGDHTLQISRQATPKNDHQARQNSNARAVQASWHLTQLLYSTVRPPFGIC
jgi:hypothetical protein